MRKTETKVTKKIEDNLLLGCSLLLEKKAKKIIRLGMRQYINHKEMPIVKNHDWHFYDIVFLDNLRKKILVVNCKNCQRA